jgi:hypothetical protein
MQWSIGVMEQCSSGEAGTGISLLHHSNTA